MTFLIGIACLVVFLMQGSDHQRRTDAWQFYRQSGLLEIESNAFLADLEKRGKTDVIAKLGASGKRDRIQLAMAMEADRDFMRRLRDNQVISANQQEYTRWRDNRKQFENLRSRIFTERYALVPGNPQPITVFSHMFLHGDVMHLAGNMAVLFVVGYTVEAALGPLGFLVLYLLGGVGAALPDLVLPSQGFQFSLGASGAISAVMAAYVVLFGLRRINFFYWVVVFFGTARWPALFVLPIWLFNEAAQKLVFNPGNNVNYAAHFAGLVVGAMLTGAYRWSRRGRSAEIVHRQDADAALNALRQQADSHIGEMQFAAASRVYRQMFSEHRTTDEGLAAEYLHIARLTRHTGFIADATQWLARLATQPNNGISPAFLASALNGGKPVVMPKLSSRRWEMVIGRLIAGRQLEAADALLVRLATRPGFEAETPGLIDRLVDAFRATDQEEKAQALMQFAKKLAARPARSGT